MGVNDFAYIGGLNRGDRYPLSEFLPQFPQNVFSYWVDKNHLTKSLLIDPISASPHLAVELGSQGYRILCSRSNPIIWLMTEAMCDHKVHQKIRQVVNKLLISRYNTQTLEEYLKEIYATNCASCGKMIQPQGFIWERGAERPISKVYACPFCGDTGEREISAIDIEKLNGLGKVDIYRARAKQRVAAEDDYQARSIDSALDCYLPRSLYICMLLVNRFEILALDKNQSKFLRAALLTVFDDAHKLHHWPIRSYRFLQLAVPQRFFEINLFQSLENIDKKWPIIPKNVPITYWPYLPSDGGGICFYQRKLAEGKEIIAESEDAAITTIFPRPGRAFWTLSAVWAGWLWGKNAVKPLRSALSRRRYDWYWYARAIDRSMNRITHSISPGLRLFGIFPDFSPSLVFGLFAGMQKAKLKLKGAAFREGERLLQGEWELSNTNEINTEAELDISKIIVDFLNYIGEPVNFQQLIMQVIFSRIQNENFPSNDDKFDDQEFTRINNLVKQTLTQSNLITVFTSENQAGSLYWLFNDNQSKAPCSERIEKYITDILQRSNEITRGSLDQLTCMRFPGLLTPDYSLIENIIDSYTYHDQEHNTYRLKDNEFIEKRVQDENEISSLLKSIGSRLGYVTNSGENIEWLDANSKEIKYDFVLVTSAMISEFLFKSSLHENSTHVLIYPGSRAGLINFRIQMDPRIKEALKEGWHLVKYRHIRRLADDEKLTIQTWKDLLDADPPLRESPAQLQMV